MYIAIIIGLAVVGSWVLYVERSLIRQAIASYGWLTTDGVVVDYTDASFTSEGIDRNFGVGPVTYKETKYIYEYQVGEHTYRSNTYCFGAHVEQARAAFLVGTKVRIYYDPKDPQNAVIKRGVQISMFLGPLLIGAALYLALELLFRR
jgi:hypothetical protein